MPRVVSGRAERVLPGVPAALDTKVIGKQLGQADGGRVGGDREEDRASAEEKKSYHGGSPPLWTAPATLASNGDPMLSTRRMPPRR
ncbi:MAG: hypothetical protein M3256_28070, partial [Actinomycetota bacterium]|nr:hypothetical protein [Actinomycetota bacterium]